MIIYSFWKHYYYKTILILHAKLEKQNVKLQMLIS